MSVLKIHVTYWCTAECEHCRFGCTRQRREVIDAGLVMDCVRDLQRLNRLELVVLMGGEPGLVPELTQRLAADITALGIAVRVETNASWATDEPAARRFLQPLYAAGTSLMLSLDAWHEPFVPPAHVLLAAQVSETLYGQYALESAYLDYPRCESEEDRRTNALLADFEQKLGKTPPGYKGTILYNARAGRRLAGRVSAGRGVPAGVCDQVPWWSDSQLATLDLLELDPQGYLSKGCGIAIADLHQISIADFLAGYKASQHPIFATLMTTGPLGLAREAQEFGYEIKADYADKCQLCQEAREKLRTKYPQYLVPAQHYL